MQPKHQSDMSSQISIPTSSADWRFILPITEDSRVLVVGGERDDFTELFGKAGVSAVIWLHDLSLTNIEDKNEENKFDIVAMPYGFSGSELHEVDIYQMIRQLIRPEGIILIGFSNMLGLFGRGFHSRSHYSTPWSMVRKLYLLGYSQIDLYGAMPTLDSPEYIFPLKTELLGFTLQHRYRYKLPAILLHFFSSKPIVSVFLYFLSYYFIIAKADTSTESTL